MASLADIIGKKVMGYTDINDYDGPGTIVAFSVTTPNCVVVEWGIPDGEHWKFYNATASVENIDDLVFV